MTGPDYRALWRTAIHQQILLLRMEKENQRLEASRDELHIRTMKLHYQEVGRCSKEVLALWERKLSAPGRTTVPQDKEELYRALSQGRTFPTIQYFSAQLGAGQLSLYNLLKAYSLLDTEVHPPALFIFPTVGYCQGISFLAGVLLLHLSEDQAFDMLKFLMYDLGIRQQFRPDMVSLQVGPPNGPRDRRICSGVVYFVFVQGTGVIFKVALCLLSSHEGALVECDSFESIVDYLKTTLPALTQAQMEQTIAKVTEMDISKQLHAYEVEYHVLQDEMLEAGPPPDDSDRLDKLEKTNVQLKKQNMELLEKLQAARHKIQTLETSVESFLSRESKMKHVMRTLEQERAAHQKTIERMRSRLPPDALTDVEMTQIKAGPNGKAKTAAAKKP
ncbi:TBC1 domain family member 4 [Liparis tanakae]|uniref:TBC1 domain family member 4 n=1 Tax=Liparis tanakae TaxID=230148 RepID=A0A4Z2HM25_9TELE|nr:TBC1 domain family member 4 [Liparis tanakae]